MKLSELKENAQAGLRNMGQNIQQGNFPSLSAPKVDPLDLRRSELLAQRAQQGEQLRNTKSEYNDIIQNAVKKGGYIPIQPQVLGASTGDQPMPEPAIIKDQPGKILDVAKHKGISSTDIPVPNKDIQNILWEELPNEATSAAVVLAGENGNFDPNAINENNNGTVDLGLFQNNSGTLSEMLTKGKYARQLNAAGIYKPEDVRGKTLDHARKSAIATRVTRQYEQDAGAAPWSWWYGWQNKGYNIDPSRGNVQELSSGNSPYFKLRERVLQ